MYNKTILIGNLTKDPEVRYTPQGTAVCTFRIAVNYPVKQKEDVLFIDIVAFDKLAETCGQYLSKGRTVLVDGRLRERRWETEEGQQRSKVEVIAQVVQFISRKPERTDDFESIFETEDPF